MKWSLALAHALSSAALTAGQPFMKRTGCRSWIIGNELWNLTQNNVNGVKLMHDGKDLVGKARGHYASYNGGTALNWTSASVVAQGELDNGKPFIDVKFTSYEGDMHWVIVEGLLGSYQYFVNKALPVLGEFRTLWRLDNTTFPYGVTAERDELLPPLSGFLPENNVGDETWLKPDGSGYYTKYDMAGFLRNQKVFGLYGATHGSWYINPGTDYYNGNHAKQELFLHRESRTGDATQLHMIHGTHFQASSNDEFPVGKIWGPWLWYLNNGSKADALARADAEALLWPYRSFMRDPGHLARATTVRGRLVLSDGRPAAYAAVFLGDNHPSKTALDMGSAYYYTSYADSAGEFVFQDVRAGSYALQAWGNGTHGVGGSAGLADVTTTFLHNDVVVEGVGEDMTLGELTWAVSTRKKVFQIGDYDRYSYGFRFGGAPRQHGLVSECPANLVFEYGVSRTDEWCFGQTHLGNWTLRFPVVEGLLSGDSSPDSGPAILTISLASYSSGVNSIVWMNGKEVGQMVSGAAGLSNDAGLYRSATACGEWRALEFAVPKEVLVGGMNELRFEITKTGQWRGFMWDSIFLEM